MKNLLVRTISGLIFGAIFLAGLLWHPIAYCVIFTAATVIMMQEYLSITLGRSGHPAKVFSLLTGALTFVLMFLTQGYGLDSKWLVILPVCALVIPMVILFTKQPGSYPKSPFLLSALLYIALPFAVTNLIVFDPLTGEFDAKVLLAVMLVIWASDVGAYMFGMALGQRYGRKLFPSISPKKSWIGYWGGLFLALVCGWAVRAVGLVDFPLAHCLIIAVIVNVTSTLGDLAESQLKRNFEVKDSGKIMPGHGGLLDRFDGALFAFPVAVLYIILFGL